MGVKKDRGHRAMQGPGRPQGHTGATEATGPQGHRAMQGPQRPQWCIVMSGMTKFSTMYFEIFHHFDYIHVGLITYYDNFHKL
jgi:hypothetical protein